MSFLFQINIVILQYINDKMGTTKTQIFSKQQNELAQSFKVLGHPARVAILQYISQQEACICNDIVDEIGLAQPTISQHLQVISKAGLIKGNFKGNSICYCININRFQEFQDLFNNYFNTTTANCCQL